MGIRTGMNAPAVLIDKYLNSAYDVVKEVADNLDNINSILEYINDTIDGTGNVVTTTKYVAIEGQTEFVIPVVSIVHTTVFVNGVYQVPDSSGVTEAYSVDVNHIVFNTPLNVGDVVVVIAASNIVASDLTTAIINGTELLKESVSYVVGTDTDKITVGASTTLVSGLPFSYSLGNKELQVHVNGIYQNITSGAYTETSSTSITFTEALQTGDRIDIFKITGQIG